MKHRNAKALDHPKMERRNPGNAPLKLSARDEQTLRYGRGGQADDTRWLPEAAAGAMQAVGTDRIARAAFGLAAKTLGRAAPVFRPAPAKAGGVHVPRSAATAKDAEALALYDRLLDGERFGSLPREAQLDIARRTGWQELPTGETVRQIPRFEFGPGWRRYEPFATETRAVLSGVAENEVGAVPPMTMAEAFAGDGAKELFRRYPNAKNWFVRADRAPAPRVMGFSEPGSTAVTVTDEGLMRGAEPVLNTVHHETQHVIQNMSGMSPGSTSADALAELKTGIGNAMLDGRGSDPAVMRAVDALQQAMKSSDPAYHAYQHAGGEAGAFAAGNAAVEGRTGELIADAMSREGIVPENVYDLRALRQDAKGGEDRFSMSRNFLATDKVPDTIFGIPVVSRREDYTEADIEFFREHPEAGGYYDLGDEAEDRGSDAALFAGVPVLSAAEGFGPAGVSKASEQLPAARRKAVSALNRNMGYRTHSTAVGKMMDYGLARTSETIAKATTRAQNLRDEGKATPGFGGAVRQAAGSVAASLGSYAQPLVGGVRQLAATWLSNGGKNYTPEPNTEKMFSRDALQELSNARSRTGGTGIVSSKAYGNNGGLLGILSNPTRFEAEAPTGSMSERDGALVDVADMNINYQGGDAPYQKEYPLSVRTVTAAANAAGNLFAAAAGSSDDPDAGKIKTVIPVDKLPAPVSAPVSSGSLEAALARSAKMLEGFDKDKDKRRATQISTRQDTKGGKARGRYPGSLNNPGNVEKHRTRRAGEVDSPHDRWAKFDTPQNGLAASAAVVREIAESKLAMENKPFTIRNYAEKYAPRSENDTDAYVRNLSRYSGIGADDVLDLWDTDAMSRLLRAKVRFESGVPHSQWFTDDEYRAAAEAMKEGAFD